MECPECQLEVPDESNFCNRCGCRLTGSIDIGQPAIQIEGERKHVTVMFSDLSGYTSMNEKLDPEEVKNLMGRIFTEAGKIVDKYDGTVERFFGDEVMAVFGVPVSHEDDPVRAVKAATELHAFVSSLSPEYEPQIGKPLSMHSGINTGLVVTGEEFIGKDRHGLTGDTINFAKRLTGLAGEGEILVGPETCRQVQGFFKTKECEPTRVKGKAEAVRIFSIISAKDSPESIHRLKGVRADLIGRDEEIGVLFKAAEELRKGQGGVVNLVGDAGMGKSRLLREFKAKLPADRFQWREGHAYSYAKDTPYHPLANLLNHAFGIREQDTPDRIREKIEQRLMELLGRNNTAAFFIGGLFSITYSEVADISPESWMSKLYEAVQQTLKALSRRAPTIICFEDLHWADPSTVEMLYRLLTDFSETVLFLCTYRPPFELLSENELKESIHHIWEIRLKDLDEERSRQMLTSLLRSESIPKELANFVCEKSEGNPFYLEEVVNSLIESGMLTRNNGTWTLSRKITKTEIPSSIQGVLTARIDRLKAPSKRILQEASVIGRAFLHRILEAITDIDKPIYRYLAGLEQLDMIRTRTIEPDLEYIFKHALTQEVVYKGLLKKDRQEIHERIGLAIEQLFSERLADFFEILSFHFKQGVSNNKAVKYLMKAGKKSFSRCSVIESHRLYKEAFDLLSQDLSENRQRDELIIELLNEWGLVFIWRGDTEGFIHLLKENERLAESIEDKEKKGLFFSELGIVLCHREEFEKSYFYQKKALELGETSRSPKATGHALFRLAAVCANLGYLDEAVRYGERACQFSKDPSAEIPFHRVALGLLNAYWFKGDIKKLRELGRQFNDKEEKILDIRHRVVGNLLLGAAELNSGNFAKAIKYFASATKDSLDPFLIQISTLYLGHAYLADEQFNEALSISEEVMNFSERYSFNFLGTIAMAFRGSALISTGILHDGLKYLEEAMERWQQAKRQCTLAFAHILYGQVYLSILEGKKPLSITFIFKNFIPLIKLIPGTSKKALMHFKEAIKISEEIGAHGLRGQAYLGLARLHRAKSRDDKAQESLLTASSIFESIEADGFFQQTKNLLRSLQQ